MPASLPVSLPDGTAVPALFDAPPAPWAALVLAHGAGAGMEHPFLGALAAGLAARGVAVLRPQFPFMARGSRRPDPPAVAHATVRAAVQALAAACLGVPLFAGGKSFGGRMSSQAHALGLLPGVRGLVFVGFPLHPAGQPGTDRARHLAEVAVPMLFLQGTRDALAEWALVEPVVRGLGPRATLHRVEAADHAFHVLVRSGRTDAQVRSELVEATAAWLRARAA